MSADAANLAWVLVCAFLVMLMQLGFALVETGFTRARNAVNTMAMNLIVYPIGVIGFWLTGFGLAFGGVSGWPTLGPPASAHEVGFHLGGHFFGLIGGSKFALVDVAYDPPNLAMFLFAVVFMDTAATIPTGALAERWRFSAFVVYAFFVSMFLYPLLANWVWGGGFLAGLGETLGLGHGVVDFAGSSVVHLTGGAVSLAGALVIGPRAGKFRKDGTIGSLPGHNLPMAVMGTFILSFGWFGFNAGSTLAATDVRIAAIVVNTAIASSTACLTALAYVWQRHGRPDIGMACNGLLGGLVAITASCAFVTPSGAALIGFFAGAAVPFAVHALERLRIDDPVGAIPVHGVCGAWGTLAVGLFADGTYGEGWNRVPGAVRGLMFGGASQLFAQLLGVLVVGVTAFALAYAFFRATDRLIGLRVTSEAESSGLDDVEMGADAYS